MNIKNINSFAGPHTHTHTFTHTPNKHNTHTYTNTHTYSTAVTEIVLHSLISRSKAIQQGLFVMCHFYNHCNPFNMSLMYYSIWCPGGGGENGQTLGCHRTKIVSDSPPWVKVGYQNHPCSPRSNPTFVIKIQYQNSPRSILLNTSMSEFQGCRNVFH